GAFSFRLASPSGEQSGIRNSQQHISHSISLDYVANIRGIGQTGREATSSTTSDDTISSPSSFASELGDSPPFTPRRRNTSAPSRVQDGPRNRRSSSATTVVPGGNRFQLAPAVFTPPTATSAGLSYNTQAQHTPPSPSASAASAYGDPPPLYVPAPSPEPIPAPVPLVAPAPPSVLPTIFTTTMTTTESAKVIVLFNGDYSNNEEPTSWFQQFQLAVPSSWNDARKIERFQLQLAMGSYAEDWFNGLSSAELTSMTTLRTAFMKRWPPPPRPTWTRQIQKERVRELVLKEEEVGIWTENGRVGDYGQNIWAEKVQKLALMMGDTSGSLIEYALEGIPMLLKENLTCEYSTWAEFLTAIKSVSAERLKVGREKLADNRARDNALANLQHQLSQLSIRNQTPAARTSYRTPVVGQTGNPSTVVGPNGGRGVVPFRPPLTRTQILEKATALPQRPSNEAGRRQYESDVELWHRTHGNDAPSLERPYPIHPDTAMVGSGECFRCGRVTEPPHTGYACNSPNPVKPHETRWRQLVAGMLRRLTAPARPAPTPVQYVWPTQQYYTAAAPQVYMVAQHEDWTAGGVEPDYEQENHWEGEAENYPGLPPTVDQ
ncbi:hypothetical protein HYDPIDRAFT_34845, partial [Hydnomerulius pinastri MD-312]